MLGSEKLVFDGDLTIKIMVLIWLCLNKTGICVDHLRFGTDRGYGSPVGLNPSSGPEFSSIAPKHRKTLEICDRTQR